MNCTGCGSRVYPCSCVLCDCGKLAPYVDDLAHRCECGWRSDVCCGEPMAFDATVRGTTQGGHVVIGWLVCAKCVELQLCRRSRPADALEWTLAKGGRSLTVGGAKIRADAASGVDVEAIMARVVRVPELEIEVARLRALLQKRLNHDLPHNPRET